MHRTYKLEQRVDKLEKMMTIILYYLEQEEICDEGIAEIKHWRDYFLKQCEKHFALK